MRLNELKGLSENRHSQAEGLAEATRTHREQAERVRDLTQQLERVARDLSSADWDEATGESSRATKALEGERERIHKERSLLMVENLKLTALTTRALERTEKSLKANWFREAIKEEALLLGRGILVEASRIFSDVGLVPEVRASASVTAGTVKATEAHASKLRASLSLLEATRQILEEDDAESGPA